MRRKLLRFEMPHQQGVDHVLTVYGWRRGQLRLLRLLKLDGGVQRFEEPVEVDQPSLRALKQLSQ